MTRIKWNRSDEGFVNSKERRFWISPLYMGTTRAQAYQLDDRMTDQRPTSHDRIADAKDHAEDIIEAEIKKDADSLARVLEVYNKHTTEQ